MCALFKKKVKKNTGVLDFSEEIEEPVKREEPAEEQKRPAAAKAKAINIDFEDGIEHEATGAQKKKGGSYGTSNMDKSRKKKEKLDSKQKFLANPYLADISAKINSQFKAADSHYTADYLQELKTQNQKLNSSAREVMRHTVDEEIIAEDNYKEENQESGEREMQAEAKAVPQSAATFDIPSSKMDVEEAGLEEPDMIAEPEDEEEDVADKEKIKEARNFRESQRKARSGEYIQIRKSGAKPADSYSYENSDKRRIIMKGVINQQESRRNEFVADIDEGISSDEEFPEFEKKLLTTVLKPKQEAGAKPTEGGKAEIKKLGTKDTNLQMDDLKLERGKEVEENVLYQARVIEDKKKNLSEMNESLAASSKNIESLEAEEKQGTKRLGEIRELFEFWSELSDMLSDKQIEIAGAKHLLHEAMDKYHQECMSFRLKTLNAQLIEGGSKPIEIPYSSSSKSGNPAVIEKKPQTYADTLMKNMRSQKATDYDTTMYGYASTDEEDADFTKEYVEAKTEIHQEANREIFKDVDDDFKAIGRIFEQNSSTTLAWDAIRLFYELEFLGYDPLGNTQPDFEYYSALDFQLIKGYDYLLKALLEAETKEEKEMISVLNLVRQRVLEQVVAERILEIIRYEWNFFSRQQSKNLAFVLELFIKKVFHEASDKKSASVIDTIKKIYSALLEKIKESFIVIQFPQDLKSRLCEKTMWRIYKAMENIFTFGSLLPQSNLNSLILVELMGKFVEQNLPMLDLKLQIEFMIKVLELVPEKFKKSEAFSGYFSNLKNRWYMQIVKNFEILLLQEHTYQNPEKEKSQLRQKLIYLGDLF